MPLKQFHRHGQWAQLVGSFLLSFGSIEDSINELLRQQCGPVFYKHAITLQLQPRMDLLKSLLPDRRLSQENEITLRECFDVVKGLCEVRALIAHNQVRMGSYVDEYLDLSELSGNQITRLHVIRSERSGKNITYDELADLYKKVVTVANTLVYNWVQLDVVAMGGRVPVLHAPEV
jgi:hypothetical protein